MRFVFNSKSNSDQSMVVRTCIDELSNDLNTLGQKTVINDWENYDKFDVAIFLSGESEIQKARKQNSNIIIGLADPKDSHKKEIKLADFLIVSSIESNQFDYVNLHWYFIFQDNEVALAAANRFDLGVFIISPTDKGGHLHTPSKKMAKIIRLNFKF